MIGVYVDDIVLAGKRDRRKAEVKKALPMQEQTSLDWPASIYAGVLHKYGMGEAKPVTMPVESSSKLVKTKEECETVDQAWYQSAVDSLLYLSVGTRPDIMYAVSSMWLSTWSSQTSSTGEL